MTVSARQATSSGRITGGWVRSAKLPSAKGLSRGYDRKAVDAFLLQCANGVDWLGGLLIGAENEIERLTDDVRQPHLVRATGRVMPSTGSRKRSAPATRVSPTRRRRVPTTGRVVRARP